MPTDIDELFASFGAEDLEIIADGLLKKWGDEARTVSRSTNRGDIEVVRRAQQLYTAARRAQARPSQAG